MENGSWLMVDDEQIHNQPFPIRHPLWTMKSYRQALVLGLGDSGASAASLLLSEGAAVTVIDRAQNEDLRGQARRLEQKGARVFLNASVIPDASYELCVVSPGVPATSPWIEELKRGGVRIVSELEFGWSRARGRIAAITGSNGKSTAVKFFAEALRQAGLKAVPAGNYGPPVCRAVVDQPDAEWLVLEVSSFQLETVQSFRPDVGILLNIHPNHLDRHGDMATYTALKAKLFSAASDRDVCVVYEPLMEKMRTISGGKGRWLSFGDSTLADYRYENGKIISGGCAVADFAGTYFGNDILGLAAAAIVAGIAALALDPDCAVRAAKSFSPLPHRMQRILEIGGVQFINDSKATNLAAMAAALRMLPGNVRLIAGGLVKENDFSFVKELLAQKVIGVYLIGQALEEMASAWSDIVPCVRCVTLDRAVAEAWKDSRAGETVLLSPATASFDQFRNFEERGDLFARLVKDLAEEDTNEQ
jgi:UDP-N-acetylmuramoylalanine--D-glutamate ligase